jgi:hypothetical protein
VSAPAAAVAPIAFPPGYDRAEILRPLRHGAMDDPGPSGTAYRRWVTRASPLYFWLTYLGPYLTDQETGAISFCELHMDVERTIARWQSPGPTRDAFVGPRRVGKSTLTGFGGPLWALAHDHRRFLHGFSLTDPQARGKHARIIDLLHCRGRGGTLCGPRLLADFPELAPVRGAGGPGRTVLAGGGVIAARGMGANVLGEVGDVVRPDLIVVDDPQPKETRNSDDIVAAAKSDIRTVILPMNDQAAVVLTGTVTMLGDLMDDVVRAARREPARSPDRGRWLAAERFTCHYHPADWPARWSREHLAAERARDEHTYALTYAPHLLGGQVDAARRFTSEIWCRDEHFPTAFRLISIDPAVTRRTTSDSTAIAVLGCDAMALDQRGRGRTVVEHVEQGHYDIPQTRARIFDLCEVPGRRIRPTVLLWGRQNGGESLAEQLHPLPEGVALATYAESAPKHVRIEALHAQYRRRAVWHAGVLEDYEAQAQRWTRRATRDDMLDAVAAGERYVRTGKADM